MPTMPAAIAARAERWLGHPATVTAVEVLSPGLRLVALAGDALRGRKYRPGDEVEFRVAPREFRHYTPARYDTGVGDCELFLQTYASGPGSAWAAALTVGDEVAVMGPGGGGVRFGPRPAPVVVLGDATALGVFSALAAAGGGVTGAVEIPTEDAAAASAILPGVEMLAPAAQGPGAALREWTITHAPNLTASGARIYAIGHAQTVQRLRTDLRLAGVPRQSIVAKAYWATGRTGL